MEERSYTKTILLSVIFLIAILVIVLLIYFMSPKSSPVRKAIEQATGFAPDSTSEEINNENIENFEESGFSGGGSSTGGSVDDGGSGGSSDEEGTQDPCIQEVSYSLENENSEVQCNSFENGFCVDKTIICSIEVKNRDPEIEGIFRISLKFIPEESSEALEIRVVEGTIPSLELILINETLNLNSQGEFGDANLPISCLYNTLEVPTKKIC